MKRASRRMTVSIAAVAALGLSLTACGTDTATNGDPSATGELSGTITVWAWEHSLTPVAEQFMADNPEVTVEIVNAGTSSDQYTALQNAISAGSGGPDLAQIEYPALDQFALGEALTDLAPLGADALDGTFTPGPWHAVTQGGDQVFALPLGSGPMSMFYNKTVFEELGVDVPTTWDEYVEAARAIHAADPTVYMANDAGDAGFTQSMIWQAGGKPFTVDGTSVGVDFESDEGSQKFATLWNQLLTEELLAPISPWSDEWYKGLGDGTIATLTSGAWMPGNFTSGVPEASGDWRVAAMPQWEEGASASSENGGSSLAVMEASKNHDLAYAFAHYAAVGDDVGIRVTEGNFPATVAEQQSEEFLNEEFEYFGGQQANKIFADSAANVVEGWTYLPFQAYANSIFNDHLGSTYSTNGKTTIAEGLNSWADAIKTYGEQQGFTIS